MENLEGGLVFEDTMDMAYMNDMPRIVAHHCQHHLRYYGVAPDDKLAQTAAERIKARQLVPHKDPRRIGLGTRVCVWLKGNHSKHKPPALVDLDYSDLSMVAVDIHVCRVRRVWSRQVLEALADTCNTKVLETTAARGIIQHAWALVALPFTVNCVLQFVYLGLTMINSAYLVEYDVPCAPALKMAAFVTLVEVMEEIGLLLGLCHSKGAGCTSWTGINGFFAALTRYFSSSKRVALVCTRLLDVVGVMTASIYLPDSETVFLLDHDGIFQQWFSFEHLDHMEESDHSWSGDFHGRVIIVFWSTAHWLTVLWAVRGYRAFGPRMQPILSAVYDCGTFMLVLIFMMGAATQAYYCMGFADSGPWENTAYTSFQLMFRLVIMGDFDMTELQGQNTQMEAIENSTRWEDSDPPWSPNMKLVHLFFYIISMALSITMMNLLIGILGSNYERYEEQSMPMFLQERADIAAELGRASWFHSLHKLCCWLSCRPPPPWILELSDLSAVSPTPSNTSLEGGSHARPWGVADKHMYKCLYCLCSYFRRPARGGTRGVRLREQVEKEEEEREGKEQVEPCATEDDFLWIATKQQDEVSTDDTRSVRTAMQNKLSVLKNHLTQEMHMGMAALQEEQGRMREEQGRMREMLQRVLTELPASQSAGKLPSSCPPSTNTGVPPRASIDVLMNDVTRLTQENSARLRL